MTAGPRELYKQMERALQVINRCERIARVSPSTHDYVGIMNLQGLQLEYAMKELQKQIRAKTK